MPDPVIESVVTLSTSSTVQPSPTVQPSSTVQPSPTVQPVTPKLTPTASTTVLLKLDRAKCDTRILTINGDIIAIPVTQDSVGVLFNGKSLTFTIDNIDPLGNVIDTKEYTLTDVDADNNRPSLHTL